MSSLCSREGGGDLCDAGREVLGVGSELFRGDDLVDETEIKRLQQRVGGGGTSSREKNRGGHLRMSIRLTFCEVIISPVRSIAIAAFGPTALPRATPGV